MLSPVQVLFHMMPIVGWAAVSLPVGDTAQMHYKLNSYLITVAHSSSRLPGQQQIAELIGIKCILSAKDDRDMQ